MSWVRCHARRSSKASGRRSTISASCTRKGGSIPRTWIRERETASGSGGHRALEQRFGNLDGSLDRRGEERTPLLGAGPLRVADRPVVGPRLHVLGKEKPAQHRIVVRRVVAHLVAADEIGA